MCNNAWCDLFHNIVSYNSIMNGMVAIIDDKIFILFLLPWYIHVHIYIRVHIHVHILNVRCLLWECLYVINERVNEFICVCVRVLVCGVWNYRKYLCYTSCLSFFYHIIGPDQEIDFHCWFRHKNHTYMYANNLYRTGPY